MAVSAGSIAIDLDSEQPAPQKLGRAQEGGDAAAQASATSDDRQRAAARKVSFVSLAASLLAALVGFAVGISDAELALVGFGTESLLDALSSALVLWRFKKPKARLHKDEEAAARFQEARDLRRERNSSVGIGATFVASSAMLLCFATVKLVAWDPHDPTHIVEEEKGADWSLLISVPSAIGFGGLAYWKFKLARALDSQVLRKDALCSVLGSVLAGICVFAGLMEHVSGDPEQMVIVDAVASGVIAMILLVEGSRTLWHNLGTGWAEEHQQLA